LIVVAPGALTDVAGAYDGALAKRGHAADIDLAALPAPVLMTLRDDLKKIVETFA